MFFYDSDNHINSIKFRYMDSINLFCSMQFQNIVSLHSLIFVHDVLILINAWHLVTFISDNFSM